MAQERQPWKGPGSLHVVLDGEGGATVSYDIDFGADDRRFREVVEAAVGRVASLAGRPLASPVAFSPAKEPQDPAPGAPTAFGALTADLEPAVADVTDLRRLLARYEGELKAKVADGLKAVEAQDRSDPDTPVQAPDGRRVPAAVGRALGLYSDYADDVVEAYASVERLAPVLLREGTAHGEEMELFEAVRRFENEVDVPAQVEIALSTGRVVSFPREWLRQAGALSRKPSRVFAPGSVEGRMGSHHRALEKAYGSGPLSYQFGYGPSTTPRAQGLDEYAANVAEVLHETGGGLTQAQLRSLADIPASLGQESVDRFWNAVDRVACTLPGGDVQAIRTGGADDGTRYYLWYQTDGDGRPLADYARLVAFVESLPMPPIDVERPRPDSTIEDEDERRENLALAGPYEQAVRARRTAEAVRDRWLERVRAEAEEAYPRYR